MAATNWFATMKYQLFSKEIPSHTKERRAMSYRKSVYNRVKNELGFGW